MWRCIPGQGGVYAAARGRWFALCRAGADPHSVLKDGAERPMKLPESPFRLAPENAGAQPRHRLRRDAPWVETHRDAVAHPQRKSSAVPCGPPGTPGIAPCGPVPALCKGGPAMNGHGGAPAERMRRQARRPMVRGPRGSARPQERGGGGLFARAVPCGRPSGMRPIRTQRCFRCGPRPGDGQDQTGAIGAPYRTSAGSGGRRTPTWDRLGQGPRAPSGDARRA